MGVDGVDCLQVFNECFGGLFQESLSAGVRLFKEKSTATAVEGLVQVEHDRHSGTPAKGRTIVRKVNTPPPGE